MLTEQEYRRLQREKKAQQESAERRARGEPEPERGYAVPLPSKLTARQKLDIANLDFVKRNDSFTEPPLTDLERGMSQEAFNRLPARRRNDIYSHAMFERRRRIA